MNRRRIVIGILVLAAVLAGVVFFQEPAPADAITVRFHSFSTNGTLRLGFCVVSNATEGSFTINVSTERLTNGAFAPAPALARMGYQSWGGREHGLVPTNLDPGSNTCRIVAQYRRAPTTRLGEMLEPIRTRLLGERPIMRTYSDEFLSPP